MARSVIKYIEPYNMMSKEGNGMKTLRQGEKNSYKVIISELGVSPFRMIKVAFALMGIIPLLVIFYILVGKNFLYDIFIGNAALITLAAIFISMAGFLYAYLLVKDLMEKLLAYAAERKRSDNEKTELVMAVTHDIKTPLTVIKMIGHNMAEGIGGSLSQIQLDMVGKCLAAVDKISTFIDQLINVSKTGFVRVNTSREFVRFDDIVKKEVEDISQLAKDKKVEVRYSVPDKDICLWADTDKMSRAIMNLLSNAVKYTPDGGEINVALSSNRETVKFSVMNTGPGIHPDEVGKIFKRYERLERHSSIEGTGLGLAIVKEIIDLHNGHITVASEPGKKTEFNVVLPRDLRVKNKV